MIVTLDGYRLEHEFAPGCTLGALVEEIRAGSLGDRLLVSVALNGHQYGESDLEAGLGQPLAAEDQVDLESGDRHAVSAAALRESADQIAEAGRLQPEIADQLSGGEVADALRQVGAFMEVWQTCRNVLAQCSGLVGRDLTQEQFAGRSVQEGLSELLEKLREMRDALKARDLVLLADLMHYEMPTLCETWHDLLTSLATGIEEHATAEL